VSEEKDNKQEQSEHLSKALFDARKVFIVGGIDKDIALKTCATLHAMAHISDDPITVIISSPGGHVESGDMIHDAIKFIKPEIRILATGWAASAGALIYAAADKKNRFATPNTRFLLHQPSGGVVGDATNIDIQAKQIVIMRSRLNQIFADATGQKIEKIEADMDRDYWMNADEAKEYGLVGKIIDSEADLK
jgi:ATP-dependent Clp protease protease subunit